MIYVEPIPEPKNKNLVVEPNLTKRIRQREIIALAKRSSAGQQIRNVDLKEVSEVKEPR